MSLKFGTYTEVKELVDLFYKSGFEAVKEYSGLSRETFHNRLKMYGLKANGLFKGRMEQLMEFKPDTYRLSKKEEAKIEFENSLFGKRAKKGVRSPQQKAWDTYYKQNNLVNGQHFICNEKLPAGLSDVVE